MGKRRHAVVITIGLALATAGCSSGAQTASPPSSGPPSTSASVPSTAPATASATESESPSATPTGPPVRDASADLVIWADDAQAKVLQPFVEQFGKDNGIKAVVQSVSGGRDGFVTATLAGQGPDVVVGAHDWIGTFVENNVVSPVPMSDSQKKEFLPEAINAATYNGQLYGVPYAVENIGLVRNTDLAPQRPDSLEAMVANGEKLKSGGKVTQSMAMQVGQNGDPYYLEPFLTSAGAYIFGHKPNGEFDTADLGLATAAAADAAKKIGKLAKDGALKTSIDYNVALDLFTKGETPYLIAGPWVIADVKKAGIHYAIDPIPGWQGGEPARPFLGVQMFYISSKAKNATFAQEFVLNYVAKPDIQKALYESGDRPPALKTVYDQVSKSDPDIRAWYEAGKGGHPMPSTPAMNAVWGPLAVAEANIVAGKGDPADVMKSAAEQIATAIKNG